MATATSSDYRLGFTTQEHEIDDERLELEGTLPPWLGGTLLRTGPALFEVGERTVNHLFDGMAMLHRFSIAGGEVSYGCRFLRSKAYQAASKGQIAYREFATDPCRALYGTVSTDFEPAPPTDNGSVLVGRLQDRFLAMTETPMPLIFDPKTLETNGVPAYEAPGYHCTAHPHNDRTTGELYGFATAVHGPVAYRVYGQMDERTQRIIAEIPVEQPSYMHTFGMTENYFVLMELPFVVDPTAVVYSGRPFIENYRWYPGRGTTFLVIDRQTGELVKRLKTDPFFCFHQINAYEEDGEIIFDLCAFDNAQIVEDFYLERLRAGNPPSVAPLPWRYHLPLDGGEVSRELLAEAVFELPQINYEDHNGRPYRYSYGIGIAASPTPSGWLDQIVKIDAETKQRAVWLQPGVFPLEPVFAKHPEAQAEDDGVLLSVCLDTEAGNSFLLVLDARDLNELARAHTSQHIPWHFHGLFSSAVH